MILGLFLTPGDSLTKQKNSGHLERFINYYLKPYSKEFKKVYLFSYGDTGKKFSLPARVILVPKPISIPYQLYQFILPFLHQKTIKQINVFRVFQTIGGLPLLFIKRPSVVTYGYHYHQFARIEGQSFKGKLINWFIRPVLNQATKIIVTSKENQKYLTDLGYKNKLSYIPNGVDPAIFKPAKTKPSSNLILTVGRLTHQKNHQLLLKVINSSRFKEKIKLVIIGQGPLYRILKRQISHLRLNTRIITNIPHQQLAHWYQTAAVFMLTSKIEGQPKVLLEALGSGCACLTTIFPGNVVVDGQTGLVGQSVQELTQKLDQLLDNPQQRSKLGRAARQLVKNKFDIHHLVRKEIKLIKSCLV